LIGSSSHTYAYQTLGDDVEKGVPSIVVVETVATAPLTVEVETPQRVTPAPQFGLAVPRVVVELVAIGAGELLLQTRRKYGAPLESAAVARHCCTEPEFVGVVVEDSITSYGF
jgi:hypothetical protein